MPANFPAPEDFEMPEGVSPGDTFEAMAELRLEKNGTLTVVSLEGCDCEDGGEMEKEDEGGGENGGHKKGAGFLNQIEILLGGASES
jgi:hypothetical protein